MVCKYNEIRTWYLFFGSIVGGGYYISPLVTVVYVQYCRELRAGFLRGCSASLHLIGTFVCGSFFSLVKTLSQLVGAYFCHPTNYCCVI